MDRRTFLRKGLLGSVGLGASLRSLGQGRRPVTLTFFYPVGVAGPLARIIEGYVREFEREHPDIRVTPVFGGSYAENQAKVLAAIKAGNPPDTAILLSTELFTLLHLDAIEPFESLLVGDQEGRALVEDIFPAFMANSMLDGKVWSIPFQRSTPIMYYNKQAFEEAGLDPEKPPQTWEELLEFGARLTKKDGSGRVVRWGVQIPEETWGIWMLEGLTIQAGGMLWDPNGRGCVVLFDSQYVADSLRFLTELKKRGASPPEIVRWSTTPNDFVAGRVAIMYHSTGSLGFVRQNARFPFGTAFQARKVRYGVPTGGANFYIFKGQDPVKRQATWRFIKWMTRPEMVARWSIDSGYVATRRSAWDLPMMKEYVQRVPQAVTARDQLAYAKPELSVYNRQEVHVVIERAMADVLLGSRALAEALRDGQAQINAVLTPFCRR